MTDEHLRELRKQTEIMAGREAFKASFGVIFFGVFATILIAVKFPDVPLLSSVWFIFGAPVALGILANIAVYRSLTRD